MQFVRSCTLPVGSFRWHCCTSPSRTLWFGPSPSRAYAQSTMDKPWKEKSSVWAWTSSDSAFIVAMSGSKLSAAKPHSSWARWLALYSPWRRQDSAHTVRRSSSPGYTPMLPKPQSVLESSCGVKATIFARHPRASVWTAFSVGRNFILARAQTRMESSPGFTSRSIAPRRSTQLSSTCLGSDCSMVANAQRICESSAPAMAPSLGVMATWYAVRRSRSHPVGSVAKAQSVLARAWLSMQYSWSNTRSRRLRKVVSSASSQLRGRSLPRDSVASRCRAVEVFT
mmetsp:Transcript_13501/g.38366  ORF Transcript_13501/g.38366 Transcript_13501/m.38366 type:complete len:283 (-) Transcript_13501:132-980(-)